MREAFAAKDGTALRGAEGHGGVLAALRAGGAGFDARIVISVPRSYGSREHGNALGLAGFAALRLVLKLFVVEKQLFPGGEDEFRAAIDAGEYFVLKFH